MIVVKNKFTIVSCGMSSYLPRMGSSHRLDCCRSTRLRLVDLQQSSRFDDPNRGKLEDIPRETIANLLIVQRLRGFEMDCYITSFRRLMCMLSQLNSKFIIINNNGPQNIFSPFTL